MAHAYHDLSRPPRPRLATRGDQGHPSASWRARDYPADEAQRREHFQTSLARTSAAIGVGLALAVAGVVLYFASQA